MDPFCGAPLSARFVFFLGSFCRDWQWDCSGYPKKYFFPVPGWLRNFLSDSNRGFFAVFLSGLESTRPTRVITFCRLFIPFPSRGHAVLVPLNYGSLPGQNARCVRPPVPESRSPPQPLWMRVSRIKVMDCSSPALLVCKQKCCTSVGSASFFEESELELSVCRNGTFLLKLKTFSGYHSGLLSIAEGVHYGSRFRLRFPLWLGELGASLEPTDISWSQGSHYVVSLR